MATKNAARLQTTRVKTVPFQRRHPVAHAGWVACRVTGRLMWRAGGASAKWVGARTVATTSAVSTRASNYAQYGRFGSASCGCGWSGPPELTARHVCDQEASGFTGDRLSAQEPGRVRATAQRMDREVAVFTGHDQGRSERLAAARAAADVRHRNRLKPWRRNAPIAVARPSPVELNPPPTHPAVTAPPTPTRKDTLVPSAPPLFPALDVVDPAELPALVSDIGRHLDRQATELATWRDQLIRQGVDPQIVFKHIQPGIEHLVTAGQAFAGATALVEQQVAHSITEGN